RISPLCLSFHLSVVATVTFASWSPESMVRTSGSRPKLPTTITLLTDAMSDAFKNVEGFGVQRIELVDDFGHVGARVLELFEDRGLFFGAALDRPGGQPHVLGDMGDDVDRQR